MPLFADRSTRKKLPNLVILALVVLLSGAFGLVAPGGLSRHSIITPDWRCLRPPSRTAKSRFKQPQHSLAPGENAWRMAKAASAAPLGLDRGGHGKVLDPEDQLLGAVKFAVTPNGIGSSNKGREAWWNARWMPSGTNRRLVSKRIFQRQAPFGISELLPCIMGCVWPSLWIHQTKGWD